MSSMTRSSRLVRFSSTAFDAFTRLRISGTQHGLQRGVHEPALLVACPSCAPSRASSTKVAASAGPIPQGATRKSLAALGGFTYPGPRKLQDIVKLPLLNAHSAPKVEEIWTQYHKHHATAIADTCTQEEFGLLMQRTKRCPLFVIPIPRPGGFMTLISQFQGRNCLITYLEDYKRDMSSAEPYLTLTLFDELVEQKGLGLIRGEVTNRLSRDEATRVLDALRRVYLGSRRNYDMVVAFNEQGSAFNFQDVLRIAGLE